MICNTIEIHGCMSEFSKLMAKSCRWILIKKILCIMFDYATYVWFGVPHSSLYSLRGYNFFKYYFKKPNFCTMQKPRPFIKHCKPVTVHKANKDDRTYIKGHWSEEVAMCASSLTCCSATCLRYAHRVGHIERLPSVHIVNRVQLGLS